MTENKSVVCRASRAFGIKNSTYTPLLLFGAIQRLENGSGRNGEF